MENCPFTDDFPIKTSIYNGFSIAMPNNQMVIHVKSLCLLVKLWRHMKDENASVGLLMESPSRACVEAWTKMMVKQHHFSRRKIPITE